MRFFYYFFFISIISHSQNKLKAFQEIIINNKLSNIQKIKKLDSIHFLIKETKNQKEKIDFTYKYSKWLYTIKNKRKYNLIKVIYNLNTFQMRGIW